MNPLDFLQLHLPALIIALPLFFAFLMPLIGKKSKKVALYLPVLITAVVEILVLWLAIIVFNEGIAIYVFGARGDPSSLTQPGGMLMPIRIIFEIDALSALMGLIGSTLVFLATLYSAAFMKKYEGLGKYATLTLLMLAGMLGLMFTGDMFNLFVFFEILSIASCGLIVFRTELAESAEAAFKYMVISTVGGLFLLFCIGIFYIEYGALNMAAIAHRMPETTFNLKDKVALGLLISVFAMKAGSAPMHMWKPDAYTAAPAPVTIMLIAAAQGSLYAMLRTVFTIYGAMINMYVIGYIIAILGVISIFVGVTMALPQKDIKRLIAYAAVAEVGYIMLALGIGLAHSSTEMGLTAVKAGLFHLLNDALDISLLFLVAGAIFYARGTRNLNALGGLGRKMKVTTILFIIGLAAVSGLPPMNGFASKLLIYETVYAFNPVLAIIALLSSILMLAIFVKIFHAVFLGPAMPENAKVREVPMPMLVAMTLIAITIIIIGLIPEYFLNTVVQPAANALMDSEGYIDRILHLGGA